MRKPTCALATVGVSLIGLNAAAQPAYVRPASVHFSAGYLVSPRPPATFGGQEAEPALVHNIVVAGGFGFSSHIEFETAVIFGTSQSLAWRQEYMFACCTERLFEDWDMPVLFYLRFNPGCDGRVCLAGLIGGGFNHHRTGDTTTARCSFTVPRICEPTPSAETEYDTWWEPAVMFGGELSLQLSKHWRVAPTARILVIRRGEYATSWDHRGPRNGSGVVPMFGVTAGWYRKLR